MQLLNKISVNSDGGKELVTCRFDLHSELSPTVNSNRFKRVSSKCPEQSYGTGGVLTQTGTHNFML